MQISNDSDRAIAEALDKLDKLNETSSQDAKGKRLEEIVVDAGPLIRDWDVSECYRWRDWTHPKIKPSGAPIIDIGIDVVAVRRSDGKHIAIQCKARQDKGAVRKSEIDSFGHAAANSFWAERWLVTSGSVKPSVQLESISNIQDKSITWINIAAALQQQQDASAEKPDTCPHCEPNPNGEFRKQTKNCMQREAVATSVDVLKEHERSDSGGLPIGQARGRIILPCGTGKTRISLRIVEELTAQGELAVILCPSIALVAQIRREYLQYANVEMRALAVCSDQTAGYDPKKEDSVIANEDPTIDRSNVSASEVKGKVTTKPEEIAEWIQSPESGNAVNVIFGTYQSGHRIAEALRQTETKAKVLIADEAHRTAGLKRKRGKTASEAEKRIRDFTLCHNNDAFPATYRVYQTATPRIYDTSKGADRNADYIIRSMDDETVFGVELYRKSYVEAVKNEWLSDYRIIALAINDPDAYEEANNLARNTQSKGRRKLSTADYMRGLAFALAMGGAAQATDKDDIKIESCIAFMNTVDKSKNMAQDLQSETVKRWVQKWLHENSPKQQTVSDYSLEHLDATSNVTERDHAKFKLATATEQEPHGIVNVGIFGEGTDSPSLNAVAFLEPRKSPVDVIQAVGRAMRTAPGKQFGYIVCPVVIPPNVDPEQWLSVSDMAEGWQELGQILLALKAHDQHIEEKLVDILHFQIPSEPEVQRTMVAVAPLEGQRIQYREHMGAPGEAPHAVQRVLEGKSKLSDEFTRIEDEPSKEIAIVKEESSQERKPVELTTIIAGKVNSDGATEMRLASIQRDKPKSDGMPGKVNIRKSKAKAKNMINRSEGLRIAPRKRRTKEERAEDSANRMLKLSGLGELGHAISMNLLTKSGISRNRVERDLNILESSISEAAFHLRSDDLSGILDRHFGLDKLKTATAQKLADGCTIASLIMMNAAMLHQRISADPTARRLFKVSPLSEIKNTTKIVQRMSREWINIMLQDFTTVLKPSLETIYAIEDNGKTAGLERALRHLAAEAERIAEIYADVGADHAGPLFNRVMGNQASDGAYFTRPPAASIAARITLDVCGDVDWTDRKVWKEHKIVDPACGSGTLLAAMLTDMKRRAQKLGASDSDIVKLQTIAVEETIKGMDINPVSLQLAATQLIAGNSYICYRKMGLRQMAYGPQDNGQVLAGTLELLSQKALLPRQGELSIPDEKIHSKKVWTPNEDAELEDAEDAELEDAVNAAKNSRIIIMNPPFTNRASMGQKFPKEVQQKLRTRTDRLEKKLILNDPEMEGFVDKSSIAPLFVALADKCLVHNDAILSMIHPTIALTNAAGLRERLILAQRYHIHTVVTCHQPGQMNMSQNTAINESVIVAKRHNGTKPPTRFVNLDKFPFDNSEVADLHESLARCEEGTIPNGWGAAFYWPADRIEAGDWTLAVWRSKELAEASYRFSNDTGMRTIKSHGYSCSATRSEIRKSKFIPAEFDTPWNFPIIDSKGAEGQKTIRSRPDAEWQTAHPDDEQRILNGGTYPEVDKLLKKAGYLLLATGHDTSTARLTAIASDKKYVGRGFEPVVGPSAWESKAIAAFVNSTAGRLQLLRNAGRKLTFPLYNPAVLGSIRIPDIQDARICRILADCWEATKAMEVPQFKKGECEVRVLWDEAVAEAMGWDRAELDRLRRLLHQEPHVRGLGYNQYADEAEDS